MTDEKVAIRPDARCAWCNETYEEHLWIAGPCESFVLIDWRTRAHAILDYIIDGPRIGAFAADDAVWLRLTLRLRGAVARAKDEESVEVSA